MVGWEDGLEQRQWGGPLAIGEEQREMRKGQEWGQEGDSSRVLAGQMQGSVAFGVITGQFLRREIVDHKGSV